MDILNCFDKPQKVIIIAVKHKVTERYIRKLMNTIPTLSFGNIEAVYKSVNGLIITETNKDMKNKQSEIISLFPIEKQPKKPQPKKPAKAEKYKAQIDEVFDYLNLATSKNFRKAKADVSLVISLLDDKRTVDEIKYVIDIKTAQWLNTEHDKYLRPSTLFRASKFDSYVNEKPIIKSKSVGQKNYEALQRYKQAKSINQNK